MIHVLYMYMYQFYTRYCRPSKCGLSSRRMELVRFCVEAFRGVAKATHRHISSFMGFLRYVRLLQLYGRGGDFFFFAACSPEIYFLLSRLLVWRMELVSHTVTTEGRASYLVSPLARYNIL